MTLCVAPRQTLVRVGAPRLKWLRALESEREIEAFKNRFAFSFAKRDCLLIVCLADSAVVTPVSPCLSLPLTRQPDRYQLFSLSEQAKRTMQANWSSSSSSSSNGQSPGRTWGNKKQAANERLIAPNVSAHTQRNAPWAAASSRTTTDRKKPALIMADTAAAAVVLRALSWSGERLVVNLDGSGVFAPPPPDIKNVSAPDLLCWLKASTSAAAWLRRAWSFSECCSFPGLPLTRVTHKGMDTGEVNANRHERVRSLFGSCHRSEDLSQIGGVYGRHLPVAACKAWGERKT